MQLVKRMSAASTTRIAVSNCTPEWLQNVLPGKCTRAFNTASEIVSRSFSVMPKTDPYTLFFDMVLFGAGTFRWSVFASEMKKPPRPFVRLRDRRATPRPRLVDDGRGSRTQAKGDGAPAAAGGGAATSAGGGAAPTTPGGPAQTGAGGEMDAAIAGERATTGGREGLAA